MRPLNRPMFKMGGPIKEGIMDGMKEPQAINTVGSPLDLQMQVVVKVIIPFVPAGLKLLELQVQQL